MSKTPRKAAPKRPEPRPDPSFASLGTATLPGATIPGAAHAAMDAAMGFATRVGATLAGHPLDHPAIRQHDAPAPIPFCRQLTIIRSRGGFVLLETEPHICSGNLGPENAIAVASTRAGLVACIQEWACTPEPQRDGSDIPF